MTILRTIPVAAYSQGHRTIAPAQIPAGLSRMRFSFSNVDWTDSMSLTCTFQISLDGGATYGDAVGGILIGIARDPSGLRGIQDINLPLSVPTNATTFLVAAFSLHDPARPTVQFSTGIVVEGF